ncbi:TPA: hypothetical protein DEO28_01550 [Candidatus Dependentiae bacterium]|nr:MAG: hypothetical protein UR14_C0004G0001 [candidate division TM6 bacterium GW2011_GWE2_31_21]KKP52919.1 MAG: hypothetical protein UR43_C0008G0001 [candidate division TM6 bacterium GW2011_GWF2_33_332]HBS47840.1 hypothetical protein [Candidatus Dependentiae bacterium]HBZ73184.1 hypothetical protein [Candidatus Dependentiae bacterium]
MKKLFLLLFLGIFTTKVLPNATETVKNQNDVTKISTDANERLKNQNTTSEQTQKLEEFKKLLNDCESVKDKEKMLDLLKQVQDVLNSLSLKDGDISLVTEENDSVLYNLTKDVASKLEIPVPLIFSVKTEIYNAFAMNIDKDKKFAAIFILESLRKDLTVEELKGIIAHELGRIKHGHTQKEDFLMNSLILGGSACFCGLVILSMLSPKLGLSHDQQAYLALSIQASPILAILLCRAIYSYFSRKCEIEADTTATKITDPDAFVSALKTLDNHTVDIFKKLVTDDNFFIESYENLYKDVEQEKVIFLKKWYAKLKIWYQKNNNVQQKKESIKTLQKYLKGSIFDTHPTTEKRITNIETIKKENAAEITPAIDA